MEEINYARFVGLLEGKLLGLSYHLAKAGITLTSEEAVKVNQLAEEMINDACERSKEG